MKATNPNHRLFSIHRETGEARIPGWGGVFERVHADFIPRHMAASILNFTNRQGIQSYNIGTLSTRPGYADNPNYQLGGVTDDADELDQPSRLFAKFYPGQAAISDGKTVMFSGAGLTDLTVDTVATVDETFVLTIDTAGTPDKFSWTHDGVSGGSEVVITGSTQQVGATGPYVTFGATTGHTVDDEFSIAPFASMEYSPKVLRLAGTGSTSVFEKYNPATGNWDTITSSLSGQWYPESIMYDVPAGPYFCWIDPVNGLHVYDGSSDVAQAIPKYGGSGNIAGAMFLAQIDGMLVVTGNMTDTGEKNILYYSAPNDYTAWESHNDGGSVPLYADDDEDSQTRYITGMVTFRGRLIVFTNDGRFVISGLGTVGQRFEFYPGCGCLSGKLIVKKKDALYWWGKEGAFEWNGNEPIEIGQPIMPELFQLKMTSGLSFFGFIYEDQWWTNVKRRDGGYRNFVFDFATRQWFIFNIPMCAAWHSLSGLLDAGFLYFASPEAIGGKYKHWILGVDPLNKHYPVYGDKVTGAKASRTATAIDAQWTSGRMDFGNLYIKDFWLLHARIGTADSEPLANNGAITHARVDYNLDDDTGFSQQIDFLTGESTPFHPLSFAGTGDTENETQGTLLQIKLNVSTTKRVDIKKVYVEFKPKAITAHST